MAFFFLIRSLCYYYFLLNLRIKNLLLLLTVQKKVNLIDFDIFLIFSIINY
jgi:hypothetical protein